MPLSGTLAALKDLFSAVRTIVSPAGVSSTQLTPADLGRLIVVDTDAAVADAVEIVLPQIAGDAGSGVNGIGAGGVFAILRTGSNAGSLNITSPAGTPDTFNGGQAFGPIDLATQNGWLIAISPGGTGVQDWSILASLPGAL